MGAKKVKEWYEIENDFREMQEMSCKPKFKRVPNGYITDEDKSVKWNKEQVEKHNAKHEAEVKKLNTLKNKARDRIYDDIYRKIQKDIGYGLSREEAVLIWDYIVKTYHGSDIDALGHHTNRLTGLISNILKIRCDKEK